MVTRQDPQGNVWGASQRISVKEALRICTVHGAYASFEEDIKGSLTPGKLADLVVLGSDPEKVDVNRLKDIPVQMTMVDGRVVHEA
jgi:predicted amidohydrolase YtcJ